jgi:oligoribonuclease (3'-5' exoribonuclease)
MEILGINKNYSSNTTYCVVDSSVYFSFQRIDEIDLLFSFCEGNAVITPKIEKEIFGESTFDYYAVDFFNPWIRTPKNNNSTLMSSNYSNQNNTTLNRTIDKYRQYFYLANVDYSSITSTVDTLLWQYDFSKLKSEGDKEIAKWIVLNPENILLTNDQPIKKFFKSSKIKIFGAIRILIILVKRGLITFEKAEEIYNRWNKIDPGSCIWKKDNKIKYIVEFKRIYLNFEL